MPPWTMAWARTLAAALVLLARAAAGLEAELGSHVALLMERGGAGNATASHLDAAVNSKASATAPSRPSPAKPAAEAAEAAAVPDEQHQAALLEKRQMAGGAPDGDLDAATNPKTTTHVPMERPVAVAMPPPAAAPDVTPLLVRQQGLDTAKKAESLDATVRGKSIDPRLVIPWRSRKPEKPPAVSMPDFLVPPKKGFKPPPGSLVPGRWVEVEEEKKEEPKEPAPPAWPQWNFWPTSRPAPVAKVVRAPPPPPAAPAPAPPPPVVQTVEEVPVLRRASRGIVIPVRKPPKIRKELPYKSVNVVKLEPGPMNVVEKKEEPLFKAVKIPPPTVQKAAPIIVQPAVPVPAAAVAAVARAPAAASQRSPAAALVEARLQPALPGFDD